MIYPHTYASPMDRYMLHYTNKYDGFISRIEVEKCVLAA